MTLPKGYTSSQSSRNRSFNDWWTTVPEDLGQKAVEETKRINHY